MKYAWTVALLLVVSLGCAKQEKVEAPAPEKPLIPAEGLQLWLEADDAIANAKNGKVQSWGAATAVHPDRLPAVVANALNDHAVVRFDGTDQMLKSTVDIGPVKMPDATIITVIRSKTADASPLRKVYGNDNGGFDRAVGLDDRAPGKNFTVFNGIYAEGYFALQAETPYIVVDQYARDEFSGWINGAATLTKVKSAWQDDALPNLYIGGTGTVFNEYWNGDLAEMIVYARKLSDAERMQIEKYLGEKYGVR